MKINLFTLTNRARALIGGAAAIASLATIHAQEVFTFPVESESGVISVEWVGDETARAGQKYDYTLRIKNSSATPVHDIVVHQSLPASFQLQNSKPASHETPRNSAAMTADAQTMMREESQLRRSHAADAAERQMEAADGKQAGAPEKDGDASKKQPSQDAKESQLGESVENGQDQQTREYSWRVGALAPGEQTEVTVSGLPLSEGSVETCVWVSYQPTLCRQISVVKPDLELTQQIVDLEGEERDMFYACETIVARYELTNSGSGTTADATISIQAPEGFKVSEGEGTDLKVGALAAGETVERTVRFNAEKTGDFDLSANATTGDLEAQSEKASVEIVRAELELMVQAPQTAYLGRSVTYQIEVRNIGDVPALNTVVTMPIPADALRFVSNGELVPDSTDAFLLGRIESGESKSFGVTFDPGDIGKVTVKAVASAFCADDASQEFATNVKGIPAVQISVVDRQDPVKVGEDTVYEIVLRNEGSADDLDLQLTGELPASLEFVEAKGDTDVSGEGGSVNFGMLEKLGPGEVASWMVTVKGTEKGRGNFTLELQSDAFKRVTSSEPTTVY